MKFWILVKKKNGKIIKAEAYGSIAKILEDNEIFIDGKKQSYRQLQYNLRFDFHQDKDLYIKKSELLTKKQRK